ncbi:MAG: hypothetical protein ACYC96_01075 [Fimbriimonadaceae bacterium]
MLLLLGGGAALAQINNGGFEANPGFTGWTTAGDAQIQGASLGSGPVDGVQQALLASETDGTVNPSVVAGSGVSETAVEASLGLAAGSLATFSGNSVGLSSAVSQSINLVAGDTVSFSWDFLTNQTYNDGTSASIAPTLANNDFSFVSLSQGGAGQIFKLADTFYGYVNNSSLPGGFGTGFTITPYSPGPPLVADPFISETGYQTYSFTASATGTYTLGVGVSQAYLSSPDGVNSGLLVDNFTITPEPCTSTALLLFGVALVRRRRGSA